MDALYSISQEVDLFNLRSGKDETLFSHSDEFILPTDEFIAKYVQNKRLRDLLAYMSPKCGGVAGHRPAYVHGMINVLYINGSSQFVGGSQQLADRLADVIRSHGGQIKVNDAVEHIEVVDRMVESVITRKHKKYMGDWYISD